MGEGQVYHYLLTRKELWQAGWEETRAMVIAATSARKARSIARDSTSDPRWLSPVNAKIESIGLATGSREYIVLEDNVGS